MSKQKTKKAPAKKKAIKKVDKNLPAVKKSTEVVTVNQVTESTIDQFLFGTDTKLNDQQKLLFKKTAVMFNLNPFKREIYAVSFGNRMNIITGYEVYLKKANTLKLLNGWQVKCEGQGNDLRAIVTIYRKDWKHEFIHEVYMREYNQNNSMWKSKPITMIKKVAMAQAFRLCFTEEFSGMPYTTDEMPLKDGDIDQPVPQAESVSEPVQEIITEAKTIDQLKAEFTEAYQKYASMIEPTDKLNTFMANIDTMTDKEIQRGINGLNISINKIQGEKNV